MLIQSLRALVNALKKGVTQGSLDHTTTPRINSPITPTNHHFHFIRRLKSCLRISMQKLMKKSICRVHYGLRWSDKYISLACHFTRFPEGGLWNVLGPNSNAHWFGGWVTLSLVKWHGMQIHGTDKEWKTFMIPSIPQSILYSMIKRNAWYRLDYELIKDTPLLAHEGEQWSVFCEYFGEKSCMIKRFHCKPLRIKLLLELSLLIHS